MKWEYKTLDKLGNISRGRSRHRPRNDAILFGGKYPFIQTADIKSANLYLTEYTETYNDRGLEQSKLWHPGTLCITIAANIADTAILGIDACFPDSVMGFIPYAGVSNAKFLKYAFDLLQRNCKKISQGTAQDNLSWQKLSTIKFPAPPIEIQNKIAEYLSAYDDLIENNQKQIKLLEEAAQRLYKEWFVDFRFPGHENTPIVNGIPKGWKLVPLSKLISYEIGGGWGEEYSTGKCIKEAYVIRGTDLYGIIHGDLLSIPLRYHAESNLLARRLQEGDIIFEVSGGSKNEGVARSFLITSEILNYWGKPVMCASFCKLIRSEPSYSQYLYDYFKYMRATRRTEEYDKRSASNIVNYRWKDFLSQELLFQPPDKIVQQYNNIAKDIYLKIIMCSLQMETSKVARDRLLPKLMNGEIEV